MNNDSYQRTIQALPNDTLDAIAHRVYAKRSTELLPQIIDSNDRYSPYALLPTNAIIILPDDTAVTAAPSIKIWD